MTFGTVVGLLITSLYARPVVALPFLLLAIVAYLPFYRYHKKKAVHYHLHFSLLRPKHHFSELFNGYFHGHIRWKHLLNFKNKALLMLNIRWIFVLLAPAPVYAMYPLLMKKAFHLSTTGSSLVYALSTAIGVVLFITAGNIAKKKSAFFTMNMGIFSYALSFVLMLGGMWTGLYFIGILGFMLMIFSWAFISVGMNISVVELTDEQKRGEALGLANSFQSIDNVLGGAIGGFLVASMGYPVIMYFGIFFSGIAILLSVFQNKTKTENYVIQKEKN
jgi:predicted MFS family arabinose efflux permease